MLQLRFINTIQLQIAYVAEAQLHIVNHEQQMFI